MASPPPARQGSRWSSLLQQAVAGVESRLDTILAEEDSAGATVRSSDGKGSQSARTRSPSITQALKADNGSVGADPPRLATPSLTENSGPSRTPSASNGKAQDRLQERLARAMARKDQSRNASSPASSEVPSRTASPKPAGDESTRTSLEVRGLEGSESYPTSQASMDIPRVSVDLPPSPSSASVKGTSSEPDKVSQEAGSSSRDVSHRRSMEEQDVVPSTTLQSPPQPQAPNEMSSNKTKSIEEYEHLLAQLKADYETAELQRQDEMHTYVERIDALHSKVQYLSKDSAEAARNAVSSATSGSTEKKLAEKDEQIALLIEEGTNLSKSEMKYLGTIKKLRAKIAEGEKASSDARKKQDQAEKEAREAKEKLKRVEAAEKRANDRLRLLAKVEKEVITVKAERDESRALTATLRTNLARATSRAEDAESRAQTEALDAERRISSSLRDELSSAKMEKELSEDLARSEIRDLKERSERERERARVMEVELKGEQAMLESKMEALRARAEEASTGATGDAQVKLLRQIETLQSQYAVASENWQGIEGSLMTRISSLEKERDDVSSREADIRRKAREVNQKFRRTDEELESSRNALQAAESELEDHKYQLKQLLQRIEQSEMAFKDAKASHDRERQIWEAELSQRLEQERAKWREEAPPSFPQQHRYRTESPPTFSRKSSLSDLLALQTRLPGRVPSSGDFPGHMHDRPANRRPSTQPMRSPDPGTPNRRDSMSHMLPVSNGSIPETPSIHTPDRDEMFDGMPSSPRRTINDMISGSTVAAGPSVQLVERMSAAVRRLESEKAASREELARLSTQRDDARREIVALMQEVEAKRAADVRIEELEAEVHAINDRYQTTLEMLGEKSELVEELRADVADVKKIYRELVESTMS
ncbi:MAG: hypothetical protein M1825_003006 [Sarcosagium campestre]|nr:MAG: hypothetical protein M1825_003006 [Sarcosagium campestre]